MVKVLVVALLSVSAGCAARGPAASRADEIVVDRLWFGSAIPGGGEVGDSAWRVFVDEVVTPRFPAGLTLLRGDGQWRDPRGDLVREKALILEIFHPANAAADSAIEAIAREYIRRYRQDAVLHVRGTARMRLIEARDR